MQLKPATLLKVAHLHGCFSHFLNDAKGTKSRNASHVCSQPFQVKVWLKSTTMAL